MLDKLSTSIKNMWDSILVKVKSFNKPTEWFVTMGSYLIGGFIAGFILKHYIKYLILTILAVVLLLTVFNHYSIININYNLLNNVYGLNKPVTISEIIDIFVIWVKGHLAEFIALCIGLFLAAELA
jgi:uncharacterized membrane protein (Fun14 family)